MFKSSNFTNYIVYSVDVYPGIRSMTPPYVPETSDLEAATNFPEVEKPDQPVELFKESRKFEGNHLPFIGFTSGWENALIRALGEQIGVGVEGELSIPVGEVAVSVPAALGRPISPKKDLRSVSPSKQAGSEIQIEVCFVCHLPTLYCLFTTYYLTMRLD